MMKPKKKIIIKNKEREREREKWVEDGTTLNQVDHVTPTVDQSAMAFRFGCHFENCRKMEISISCSDSDFESIEMIDLMLVRCSIGAVT